MKPLFSTACLIFYSFWHEAVHESLRIVFGWGMHENEERFLASVNDALDAAFRASMWKDNWIQETFKYAP